MTMSPRIAALAVAVAMLAAGPASAHHNDWAAPLVGGALGGYALGTIVANSNHPVEKVYEPAPTYYANPAPVYYTPPPAAVPSAATIEAQLAQLDKLAAAGYITPQEYKTRRQALLNELSPP